MLLLRSITSKTLLRPGEAIAAALAAPGAAQAVDGALDTAATLEWRNYMVSGYEDSGQVKWLADSGIELIRGSGRIVEPSMLEVEMEVGSRTEMHSHPDTLIYIISGGKVTFTDPSGEVVDLETSDGETVCRPASSVMATNGTPRQMLAKIADQRAFQKSPRKSMLLEMMPR